MTNHKFSSVKKDRWFYNRFEYCLSFYLAEASCLRKLDHLSIDDMIQRRKQWQEIAQQRWVNGRQNYGTILKRHWREITDKNVENLHTLADVLIACKSEFKLVVSINQCHVYTNDLTLIDQLADIEFLTYKTFSQAQIHRAKNTIQLRNSRYSFRSYFKMIKLTSEQKDQLESFLLAQQNHVRISPALMRWIDQPFNRTQDYFFVDHESQSWLTMLNLVYPGIIRKTMPIVTAK